MKANLSSSIKLSFSFQYDFAVEKTTLIWVQERRNRVEKEERIRKERIAEYEKKKAELKAKQEEEEKLRREKELTKQEEEKARLKKEEEERIKREEEEEIKRLEEEINQEQQTQETENKQECETEDVAATPVDQIHDANGNEAVSPGVVTQETEKAVAHEAPQTLSASTSENTSYCGAINNMNSVCKSEPNVSGNTTSYDLMLKPTPFPSQKSVRSPSKTPANINFADFEGEGNDPFDSAALKSINDMEELAKVLDSSHINPKPVEGTNTHHLGTLKEGQSFPNTYPNGQIAYSTFGQYPYFMPSQQQQSLQQQNMTQPRPGFPHYGNHLAKNPQVTRTSSTPSSVSGSQYAKDPGTTFQNKYYPQPWNSGYTVNSPSKTAQFVPYDYCLQSASISNSVSNTTQGVVMSPSNKTVNTSTLPVYTSGGCTTVQSVERGTTVSKRQDLEDFYSKYYSQNKSHVHQNQQSGLQSGESTPSHSSSSGAAGSTSGSLRSCRSVPDLTAAEDSEVTRYSSGLQSHNDSRGVSHTPPPRPSSTGLTGLEVKDTCIHFMYKCGNVYILNLGKYDLQRDVHICTRGGKDANAECKSQIVSVLVHEDFLRDACDMKVVVCLTIYLSCRVYLGRRIRGRVLVGVN